MPVKKRGLGRGLNALIGDVSSVALEKSEKTLPVDQLRRGRYQARRQMDQERLQELADSTRSLLASGVGGLRSWLESMKYRF